MGLNKGQKLVRMVALMSRTGGASAGEIMAKFDLDARTMRRYLADLRELAIPFTDEGRGDERIITIDPRWRRTGVTLTLAEVLSLHFGRTLFTFLDGTRFAADLHDAIERLEPAISRAHSDLARQLDTKFVAVKEPSKDYRGTVSEIIDEAVTALVYNNPVEAHYRKVTGAPKRYELHPYTLATYRQGLYLLAFDIHAGMVKTFAIERFDEMVRKRRERFEYPTGWTPHAHLSHAFGIITGQPAEIALAFAPEVAGYIRERTWHPTQTFRTLADGRLELRLRVAVTVELQSWVLSFGADAEVLEPRELVERVGFSLTEAARRYEARRTGGQG